MKFKTHHVALTVKNTDESIEWYKDKLGFEITHRYDKHGMEITQLKKDEAQIELFCYDKNTLPLPEYRKELMSDLHVIGTKHLCIETDDLYGLIKSLNEKGVETQAVDSAGFGGKYTFIKDCNDILIELYQK